MKKETVAPTLSAHLLREADRFLIYPNRVYRTRSNLGAQEIIDRLRRKVVEWRKTFAPQPEEALSQTFGTPILLDELYCRDVLRAVPEMVDRTRHLSHLTLEGIDDPESFVYLREAANCYILGLPQAAVALARAAIESPLRKTASRLFGEQAIAAVDLRKVLDDYAHRGKILSRDSLTLAHKVRIAANEVLHRTPISPAEALAMVEAARTVVLELGRRERGTGKPSTRSAPPTPGDDHART